MIEFYERMVCQFSLGTTFNENCSCFIYFISLSRGLENQEDFVVTARNKTKFDDPEINIQWNVFNPFLARWLTSARAYRIGGRKLCPSVCLYVKRYLFLQFCTDYNQTWINMIWAVAAKTLLSQIFHNWRRIEVNCVYISHCKWYRTSAGMPACIPNRRCCAGQCAGQ